MQDFVIFAHYKYKKRVKLKTNEYEKVIVCFDGIIHYYSFHQL